MSILIFNIAGAPKWLRGLMGKNFTESSAPKTSVFDGLEPEFLDAIEKNSAVTVDMLDTPQKVAAYAVRYSTESLGEGPINGMAPIAAAEKIAEAINNTPDLLDETSAQAVLNLANERAYWSNFAVSPAPVDVNLNYTLRDHGEGKITAEHFAALEGPISPTLFVDCAEFVTEETVTAYAQGCHASSDGYKTRDEQAIATAGLGVAIKENPDLLNEETATEILKAACTNNSAHLNDAFKQHGAGVITDDTFDEITMKGMAHDGSDISLMTGDVLVSNARHITSDALMPFIEKFEAGRSHDESDIKSLAEALRLNPKLIDEQSQDALLKLTKNAPQNGERAVGSDYHKRDIAKLLEAHAPAMRQDLQTLDA